MTTPANQAIAAAEALVQANVARTQNPYGEYIGFDGIANLPTRAVPVTGLNPYFDIEGVSSTTTRVPIVPTYKQGAEWQFASLPYEAISDLQNRLVASGVLSQYTPGVWDLQSARAMEYVMTIANFSGQSFGPVLDQMIAAGGIQKVDKPSGGGLAAPTMTDEDIRTVANKTAQGVLGRNLREDEVSSFIPAFRGMFAGGTSAQTAGEMVVREQIAPEEAGAYGIGNVMQAIGAALGGAG